MIPLIFQTPLPWLIDWLPDEYAALGQEDVTVRRVTPDERPRKFVLLRDDGGPRLREVHRLHRIGAQVWATFENGTTDWDTLNAMSAQLLYLFEKAVKVSPLIATVTDSNGSYPVQNGPDEYRYLTVELQLRGIPAP